MSLQRRVGMPLDNTQRDVSNPRDSLSDRTLHADMEMFTGSMSCHASHRRRTDGLKTPTGVGLFIFKLTSWTWGRRLLFHPLRKENSFIFPRNIYAKILQTKDRNSVGSFDIPSEYKARGGNIRLSINFYAAWNYAPPSLSYINNVDYKGN